MASSSGRNRSRNPAFEECLNKHKITFFPRARKLVRKEFSSAVEDLTEAKDRLSNGKYKYATINAYYSIFHAARSLLYSKGYRERSHHCLAAALEALFADRGLMDERLVRLFKESMALRENADYSANFSQDGALLSISNAELFIDAVSNILKRSFYKEKE